MSSKASANHWIGGMGAPERQEARRALNVALAWGFLIFAHFPYIALAPIRTDLQPYAFLLSVLVCAASAFTLEMPRILWWFGLAPVAAAVLATREQSLLGYREVLTYLSIFTNTAATLAVLRLPQGTQMLRQMLTFSTLAWLTMGIMERIFSPSILHFVIPNLSLDAGRGVTGFATEPSFYGIYCLVLLGLNFLYNDNKRSIALLLLFQIIFLAQSSITIVLLLIFIAFRTIFYPSWRIIAAVVTLLLVGLALFLYVLPRYVDNVRVAFLALQILADPLTLANYDVSINARVGHVLFSVLGFLDNHGMPYGFGHFEEYVNLKAPALGYNWLGALSPDMKIMSGYGGLLFEVGAFGLATLLAVGVIVWRYFMNNWRLGALAALFATTMMFSAIQISLPVLGLALGWMVAMRNHKTAPARPA